MSDSSEELDPTANTISRCNTLNPVDQISPSDKEVLKRQFAERCITESIKLNHDSTRLANLKEQCSMLLINYLTLETNQQFLHIKQAERQFFEEVVAERFPDLLVDICDYWLNQIYFKIPSSIENQ